MTLRLKNLKKQSHRYGDSSMPNLNVQSSERPMSSSINYPLDFKGRFNGRLSSCKTLETDSTAQLTKTRRHPTQSSMGMSSSYVLTGNNKTLTKKHPRRTFGLGRNLDKNCRTERVSLSLICKSSLRQQVKPRLSPGCYDRSAPNQLDCQNEIKYDDRLYDNQERTPRKSGFKLFVQGDPLTKIFGNNDLPDILRRYQNSHDRLLQEIPIYCPRRRNPKNIILWKR